jgi:membrane dipeptidase
MDVSRRTMMAGTAAAIVAAPAMTRAKAAAGSGGWYDRAIVIDALGGTGDPYMGDDVSRMSGRRPSPLE